MSLGQKIVDAIESRRDRNRKSQPGAIGRFWSDGGNTLLYDMPVITGSLVIDACGYEGEWTAGMISLYGCRSQIFEPVPTFFEHCQTYFKNNNLVQIHKAALGGSNLKKRFNLLDDGTSEYRGDSDAQHIEADVIDVKRIFAEAGTRIACFKLNIEGANMKCWSECLKPIILPCVIAC
jgi:FkbM family methyltransferase